MAARDGGVAPLSAVGLTDELADRAGVLRRAYGEPVAKYLQDARNRYFPEMSAEAWSEVVLAAAVRGWVEEVDAHGAWAPYGEEAAVHDVDLDQDAPARLWTRATRTLLGVRIDDGALAPLTSGDVILEVDGMPLAGLGVEQLDELALTAADGDAPFDVVLMREGDRAPRTVHVEQSGDAPPAPVATAHPFDLRDRDDRLRVGPGRGRHDPGHLRRSRRALRAGARASEGAEALGRRARSPRQRRRVDRRRDRHARRVPAGRARSFR